MVTLALVWAAEQKPLPPSPVYLVPERANLTLGHLGSVRLKVCNPSVTLISYATFQLATEDAAVTPSTFSVGDLRPRQCKEVILNVLPLKEVIRLSFVASAAYALGNSKALGATSGSLTLFVRSPQLVMEPVEVSEVGGNVTLKFRNVGEAPFKGNIVITKPFFATLPLEVPPGGEGAAKAEVPPTSPGKYEVEYKARYGKAELEGKGLMIVNPDPRVTFKLGKVIEVCFPRKQQFVIRLFSRNAAPEPDSFKLELKGCTTLNYTVTPSSLPFTLSAVAKAGNLVLNDSVAMSYCDVSFNATELWAGVDNAVEVKVNCPLPVKGAVTLEPSPGAVDPPTLPLPGGAFVWSLPTSAKEAILKVKMFGKTFAYNFNVKPFNPEFTVTFEPRSVVEGSVVRERMCVENAWNKAVKDVIVKVEVSNWSSVATFDEVAPSQRVCLEGLVAVPWEVESLKAKVKIVAGSYSLEREEELEVKPNPEVAVPAIELETKSLGVGKDVVTIRVKNVGRGYAKGAGLSLSSPYLLYPSYVYLGDMPPDSSKVINATFFVPKDAKSVKLNAALSYCSGPLGGTCLPSQLKKEFEVPVRNYVPPNLVIAVKGEKLRGGKSNAVYVELANSGGDEARSVTLSASSGDSDVTPSYFMLGDIPPGKKVTLKLFVTPPERAEEAELKLEARYTDPWGSSYSASFTKKFKVVPKPSPHVAVNMLTTILKTGKSVLRFEVFNDGEVPAKGVELYVYSSGLPLSKSSFFIKELAPGQRALVEVPCSPNYPGTYSITVRVRYGNVSDTFNYKISVATGPVLKVHDAATFPEELSPGSSGILGFSLANVGDQSAADVKISVEAKGIRFTKKTLFLPRLSPGADVPAVFPFEVPAEAEPGTVPVTLKVSYLFQGEKYEKVFSASVIVKPRVKLSAESLGPEAMALALVVPIILLLLIKRRRSKTVVIE
ncbi:S-layer domain-like protein [Ignicoccus hospitalis KIN4/I]|uniref:S-layer domain-like protein n=1 Tax=Ignicoccus hospitalis (strain KIN4/I / DSM 18386 / JCM 14125) TaxID=453591 RepID=A8A9R1_IGNH4|nr:S-layer domain-like protein [Ignicoccus hospitalis KIN4/I]